MKIRTASALAAAAFALVALAGCAPATLTASAEDIADLAEGALEEQVGSRPDIDCGTGDIELKKGLVIDCTLTDPVSGDRFDAPVTIATIQGNTYTIDVQVGDAPIDPPTPESTVEPQTGDNPTVPGTDIADLAAGALESILGFLPIIECPDAEVEVFVGNSVVCAFAEDDGTQHEVRIDITEFDGSTYAINAEVIS